MTLQRAPTVFVTLTDEQRFDWVRLMRTEGVGPRTFRSLLNHSGGARAALQSLPDLARRRGATPPRIPDVQEIEIEFKAARRLGVRFVATGEAEYPRALAAIDTAPPILAVRGRADVLNLPSVALVGSRNASAAGLQFTRILAHGLGRAGFGVVSGLARGIDTAAHAAAIEGGTVAVLAGGHDRVYPAENADLLSAIAERGAVVCEMPMGWEPRGRDFPRRNRIVSGLSLGVVLVEAARRSGSLITARFALEQGREVFAVPGFPLDPRAEGTNDLLRDGATLVRGVQDVVEVLAPIVGLDDRRDGRSMAEGQGGEAKPLLWDEIDWLADGDAGASPGSAPADGAGPADDIGEEGGQKEGEPEASGRIEALLVTAPVSVDELVRQSGWPVRRVQAALLDLDLAGRLERLGGDLVALRPKGSDSLF
jgi:DNA processing protein